MYGIIRACFFFVMVALLQSSSCFAITTNDLPEKPLSEIEEKMATFLKLAGDNEKVLYKDGNIAFLENPDKGQLIFFSLMGLIVMATGASVIKMMYPLPRPLIPCLMGVFVMMMGAGLLDVGLDGMESRYAPKVFVSLNDAGLFVRGEHKCSWKDIEALHVDSVRRYGLDGLLDSTLRDVYVSNKESKPLFGYSEIGNWLPVTFDDFVVVMKYYWNKHKSNA